MRHTEFPSRTEKPLIGNSLTAPSLHLIFGVIKALFFLREQCVKEEYRYSKFYELTFELALRLYAENVTYSQFTRALSSDTTKSVVDSNPFNVNLEAWLDAYPVQKKLGKYSHEDYQDTRALLTKFTCHDSGLPLEEFPKHNYLTNCMYIVHSLKKKIEHFCPAIWKRIEKNNPKLHVPYPSKKRQTKDHYSVSIQLANSIITQGLHACTYSPWTPKRSLKTLRKALKEHGPCICGPLKKPIQHDEKKDPENIKKSQPGQLGEDLSLTVAHPYCILYQALTDTPQTSLADTSHEEKPEHYAPNSVFLVNPYQPSKAIILSYTDFCQSICPLPFYNSQGTAYALHLDSEQANQSENDEEEDSEYYSLKSGI